MKKNVFDYPKRLDDDQAAKITAIRTKMAEIIGITTTMPSSRYCSVAKQHLESAELWFTKAVQFHGVEDEN